MVHVAPANGEWYKQYRFDRTLPPEASQQEAAQVRFQSRPSNCVDFALVVTACLM